MKERPILFRGPMVRAILEGRKTMTRRVVADKHMPLVFAAALPALHESCPYGQPGDRLWVRESFQPLFADGIENHWETNWKTGKGYAISYPATDGIQEFVDADDNISSACKPSIPMPRWASRILLEITAIRVERLQDISEADARAEGAPLELGELERLILGAKAKYRSGFVRLWQSINGEQSWHENPWVWVVEFKRVQP